MTIFELAAKIALDTKEFVDGLENAKGKAAGFAQGLKGGLTTAAKTTAIAVGAVTVGAAAFTKKLYGATSQVAQTGDKIDKMSQKLGMSAEAYQEWDAIMQHSGTSIDSMQGAMRTLTNAAESNSEAFQQLGLSQEDVASMNREELFAATIKGLQGMEEGTDRAALAQSLLGRGAMELGALLNTSAEDTEAMRQKVHELGGVMSNDAVKGAATFQDTLQDLQTAFDGIKNKLFSSFMPGITEVMDGLTELLSGDKNKGIGKITAGIKSVAKKVAEVVPDFLKAGGEILKALANGIVENMPVIIDTAIPVLTSFVMGIIENLPELIHAAIGMIEQIVQSINDNIDEIINGAIDIIMALADGLVDALPKLIPAIIEIILKIVEGLIDNLDQLVDAAIKIILALAEGLIEAIPKLIEKVPEIIVKLVAAIIENAPKLLEGAWELIKKLADGLWDAAGQLWDKGVELVGKLWDGIESVFSDLIDWAGDIIDAIGEGISNVWDSIVEIGGNIISGIWEGIKGAFEWLWDKISGFFTGIVDGVKDLLGIASPSKVFAEIGGFMAKGLGVGFDKAFPGIKDGIDEKMDGLLHYDAGTANISGAFGIERANSANAAGAGGDLLGDVVSLLRDIRDRMSFAVVLDDGTIAGRVDSILGRTAALKARGN